MSAIAMAFVMGGSILKINEAEKSGAWGGFMVGVIFFVTTLILFANSDKIASSDVPMLAIAKEVNPIFATLYALVIFGLILIPSLVSIMLLGNASQQVVINASSSSWLHLPLLVSLFPSWASVNW